MGARPLRSIGIFKLGVWVGMITAAAFARRVIPSRGDEESEELALVAILNGLDLKSRAKGFKGGTMMAWFGGIALDLRDVELAPGARLTTNTLFGGIAVKTPPNWRVESSVKSLAGGVDVKTAAGDDPDAPLLTLEGLTLFGGVAVGAGEGVPAFDAT